jgi:hypothetical protein
MTKHLLPFLAGAVCLLLLAAWSSSRAGDMKEEVVPDIRLFHERFAQTPYPNKSITLEPQGVHFTFTQDQKPEYHALYSFFKLGGDFEVSVKYAWNPVNVPKKGYGVSCGIVIETNDTKKSVGLARGNFPGKGSAYRVTVGTWKADKKMDYKNEPEFATQAKSGKLIIARKKSDVTCSIVEGLDEPTELCRIKFTDAAVQRVLFYADPGEVSSDLDAKLFDIKIRADEMSHHMTKKETSNPWWGVFAGLALIVVGTSGFLIVRRIRTGTWVGREF